MRRLPLLLLALIAAPANAQVGPPRPAPHCLPGRYDGGQTEIAATLELGGDRRFRYMLSYGALDEIAEGGWSVAGDGVRLNSDPLTPPRFSKVGESETLDGALDLQLDVPRGISRQYFSAIVRFADGRSSVRQFHDEGLTMPVQADARPVSITLLLGVFDLESETFALPNGSGRLRFRFDPNDLGKVAFAETPLRFDGEDLLLDRHERIIRFRRSGDGCEVAR